MKQRFDELSRECSRMTTKKYSTSFSLGIWFLDKRIRGPVYSIYGFVRLADEIVDSFHGYDKQRLMFTFRNETKEAIEHKISFNPILNAFQEVVHRYQIPWSLIDSFLQSMEKDLQQQTYDEIDYRQYIFGSAEVVGLMCLCVFTEGHTGGYESLKPFAMKLGAAFQKVNFLRDAKSDNLELGRTYFPNVDLTNFSHAEKVSIEKDIEDDFREALKGILRLPAASRTGVFLAYYYYFMLFKKIKALPPQRILQQRIRIPDYEKFFLMLISPLRLKLHLI